MQFQMKLEILKTIFSGLIFFGLIIAFFQVRAALRISKANVLLRLIQEWNTQRLYDAVHYIHSLRLQWKRLEPDQTKWARLADAWVAEHVPVQPNSNGKEEQQRFDEWMKRRDVSQFISKMGYFMYSRYISPDDFFGVVAEARRLLVVLKPIEVSIAQHFDNETPRLGEWDRPFIKIAFDDVEEEYKCWFDRKGESLLPPTNPV
jgi:hypothetical protein